MFKYCSILLPGLLLITSGCSRSPASDVQTELSNLQQPAKPAAVDVAVAQPASIEPDVQYIGTTFPVREVALRSRVEGQIIDIVADMGDRVEQGQEVVRIDNSLSESVVTEAKAELAALESEVASSQASVNDVRAQVQQARLDLQQARSNLVRSEQLVERGAIAKQDAEIAKTEVGKAEQALRSIEQQVENRLAAVAAAQRRVAAQEALVAQEQRRQSFTVLTSPVTGAIVDRVLEPGDLAQPGSEILRLGDFSQIQIKVEISELDLASIKTGQAAQVRLDAFPDQTFTGQVTRISPAADAMARLIPVEVTMTNSNRRIGQGLLARVSFANQGVSNIVVPETAIQVAGDSSKNQDHKSSQALEGTIFVLQRIGEQATVSARQVQLGKRANSQVEVISGLESGEEFVVRSSKQLEDGEQVRLSFISELSESAP
ncbi:MAG: efflux RND transporter periplasmic adaptor subunit [Cyanobacteria bacterium P01_G01_bin.39]